MTNAEILDLPLGDDIAADSGAETIRGFLLALVTKAWTDDECFDGKRPFGNSGWRYEIHAALVRGGALEGTFDEGGYLDECDDAAADNLIILAINALAKEGDFYA